MLCMIVSVAGMTSSMSRRVEGDVTAQSQASKHAVAGTSAHMGMMHTYCKRCVQRSAVNVTRHASKPVVAQAHLTAVR